MTAISGWVGTGAGLITIGICVVAAMFVHHLPAWSHPWLHRFLIIGMYCGATAVAVTTLGQFAIRVASGIAAWFGGFGTGIGKAGIIIAGFFLLLTVLIALLKVPSAGAATIAVALVFVLALVPGGWLHQFYVVTSVPGRQFASSLATLMGG